MIKSLDYACLAHALSIKWCWLLQKHHSFYKCFIYWPRNGTCVSLHCIKPSAQRISSTDQQKLYASSKSCLWNNRFRILRKSSLISKTNKAVKIMLTCVVLLNITICGKKRKLTGYVDNVDLDRVQIQQGRITRRTMVTSRYYDSTRKDQRLECIHC